MGGNLKWQEPRCGELNCELVNFDPTGYRETLVLRTNGYVRLCRQVCAWIECRVDRRDACRTRGSRWDDVSSDFCGNCRSQKNRAVLSRESKNQMN